MIRKLARWIIMAVFVAVLYVVAAWENPTGNLGEHV